MANVSYKLNNDIETTMFLPILTYLLRIVT